MNKINRIRKIVLTIVIIILFVGLAILTGLVINNKVSIKNEIRYIEDVEYLVSEMLENGREDEVLETVKECFANMDSKIYNEAYDIIWSLVSVNLRSNDGNKFAIDVLEEMINSDNGLEKCNVLKTYNRLAILYSIEGMYSKAIELSLKSIEIAKLLEEQYYKAKSIIDLGDIFRSLGMYDAAIETTKLGIEVDIPDSKSDAKIKVYGYLNLAQIEYLNNNESEFLIYIEKLSKYIDSLSDEYIRDDYKIMRNILLADYYMNNNQLDAAKELLDGVQQDIENEGIYELVIVDKDIYYRYSLGKLQYVEGNFEEAIEAYNSTLNKAAERGNIELVKTSLENICSIYKELNDIENLEKYERGLIEVFNYEKKKIGSDYVVYTVEKYNSEKLIKEENSSKLRQMYINWALFIAFLVGGIFINKLMRHSIRDSLTNVYNRGFFNKKYSKLVKNRLSKFSIIILDIDNFKKLNDNYGHAFGDFVLVNVCKVIESVLGKGQRLFRYGGEEFVVLVLNKSSDEVYELAECIRKAVEDISWKDDIKITISIGVAHSKAVKNGGAVYDNSKAESSDGSGVINEVTADEELIKDGIVKEATYKCENVKGCKNCSDFKDCEIGKSCSITGICEDSSKCQCFTKCNDVLKNADKNLYISKNTGKNKIT